MEDFRQGVWCQILAKFIHEFFFPSSLDRQISILTEKKNHDNHNFLVKDSVSYPNRKLFTSSPIWGQKGGYCLYYPPIRTLLTEG